jgi:type II secretory pathway pseudopilin PulG
LVVIAIIGVLIGLLLPAVQAARESARRTQCANNLKQMGLAIHNHHDANGTLPAAFFGGSGFGTWMVLIMPYLEESTEYNLWDRDLRYYYQTDAARGVQVPEYFCPSRRGPPQLSMHGDDRLGPNEAGSLSDYACSVSDRQGTYNGQDINKDDSPYINGYGAMIAAFNGRLSGDGRYYTDWHSRTTLDKITDGTSNTLMVGEKHVHPDGMGLNRMFSTWQYDNSCYNGDSPFSSARVAGPGYPIASRPDELFTDNWVFGSWHTDGICQFVMCDGSVHGLSPTVDTAILGYLANRNDGYPIPANY